MPHPQPTAHAKTKPVHFVWLAPAGLPAAQQAMRRLECWRVVPFTAPDASTEDAEHVTIVGGEIYGHERHADGTGYEAFVSPEPAAAEGAVVKSLNGNSFFSRRARHLRVPRCGALQVAGCSPSFAG